MRSVGGAERASLDAELEKSPWRFGDDVSELVRLMDGRRSPAELTDALARTLTADANRLSATARSLLNVLTTPE